MLVVFGSVNIDLVLAVPHLPRPGETLLCDRYDTKYGGKGANQAVAAARAGAVVSMFGAVGRDGFGEGARRNLADNRIAVEGVTQNPDLPTGVAYICVDQAAENAIVAAEKIRVVLSSRRGLA